MCIIREWKCKELSALMENLVYHTAPPLVAGPVMAKPKNPGVVGVQEPKN